MSEVPLLGGTANRGLVTRLGDTVRRPTRDTTPATRALLDHLHAVGFHGAPRFLGIDDRGREVLSYIPGATAILPRPEWALSADALRSVARLLRRYHEAAASFDAEGQHWGRAVPSDFLGRLVTHNDPALDNVVFRDGRAVALIDFDLAGPGSAVWDVAGAIRLWAPLQPPQLVSDSRRGQLLERLSLFVRAYGLDDVGRARLLDAARANLEWCAAIVREGAQRGHPAFGARWRGGEAFETAQTARWLREAHDELERAVLG